MLLFYNDTEKFLYSSVKDDAPSAAVFMCTELELNFV